MATSETQKVRDFMAARNESPVIEARRYIPPNDPTVTKERLMDTGWSETQADELLEIHQRLESSK